jgi:hypothetical protein
MKNVIVGNNMQMEKNIMQKLQELIANDVHKTTKEFNDLPIIHTGCDTYASIYPEFKHFNKQAEVDEVVDTFAFTYSRR